MLLTGKAASQPYGQKVCVAKEKLEAWFLESCIQASAKRQGQVDVGQTRHVQLFLMELNVRASGKSAKVQMKLE